MGNKVSSSNSSFKSHNTSQGPSGPSSVWTPEQFSKQYAPFDHSSCDNEAKEEILQAILKSSEENPKQRSPIDSKFLQENADRLLCVKSQHFTGLHSLALSYQHPSAGELIRPIGICYNGKYFWDLYEASRIVLSQQTPPWHQSDEPRQHQMALNWITDVVATFHSSCYVSEPTAAFSLPTAPKFHPMIVEIAVETAMKMTSSLAVYVSLWLSFNLCKGTRLYAQDQWEFQKFDGGFIGENLGYGMQFQVNDDETQIIDGSLRHRGNLRADAFEEVRKLFFGASDGLGLGSDSIKCHPFSQVVIKTKTTMQIGHDMSGPRTTVKLTWKGKEFDSPLALLPELLIAEGWSKDVGKRPSLASGFCLSILERFNNQRRQFLPASSPVFQILGFPYHEPIVIEQNEADGSVTIRVFYMPRDDEHEKKVFKLTWTFGDDAKLISSDDSLVAIVSRNMRILLWLDGVQSGNTANIPEDTTPTTWN